MIASIELGRCAEPDTTTDSGKLWAKLEMSDSSHSVSCFPSSTMPCGTTEDGDCHGNDHCENPENSSTAATEPLSVSMLSVRFDRSVIVRFTRSHHDYTARQIKDCWYQSYELRDIKDRCGEDLLKYKLSEPTNTNNINKSSDNDESFCMRGLEGYDELAHKQKHRLRAEAASKVFEAEDDGCDEYTIAKEYASVTARSQTWANIIGLRDQRDAQSIHQSH